MFLVFGAATLFAASGATAVTLDVSGGQLLGAFDVDVDGQLFDVSFQDGTCAGLFSGCDSVADFTFQTEAAAGLAAQALLDQVFLDGVSGTFDTDPELTFGCTGTRVCAVHTPYGLSGGDVLQYETTNTSGPDSTGPLSFSATTFDTAPSGTNVFAVWTAVPEPSTTLLMASAAGMLVLLARRPHPAGR
jgi:hypothetical protein